MRHPNYLEQAARRLEADRETAERTDTCINCGGPLGRQRGGDPVCLACTRFTITDLRISDLDPMDYVALADGEGRMLSGPAE